jgi:glutaredoxin
MFRLLFRLNPSGKNLPPGKPRRKALATPFYSRFQEFLAGLAGFVGLTLIRLRRRISKAPLKDGIRLEGLASMDPHDTVLYTRQGCHLCDEALALLAKHGLSPRLVDIDADPDLFDRYNLCVPVVEIDGQERFRGHVNETLLRRLLAAK